MEKQCTSGRITVDTGAAESVWPEGLMLAVQTKPSVRSQTGVTCGAASWNRMPNLAEKKVHFKTKDGLNSSTTFQVPRSQSKETGCVSGQAKRTSRTSTGKRIDRELHNGMDVE